MVFQKGENNIAKRLDIREKLSLAKIGKKFSEEHRLNISKAQKGMKKP